MLEEKGLIKDADLFIVQERLSSYHDKIQPGIYDLSTGMTASEMLQIMSMGNEEEESTEEEAPEQETEYYDEMSDFESEESNGLLEENVDGE